MYTLILPRILKEGEYIVEAILASGTVVPAKITCQPSGTGRMIMRVDVSNKTIVGGSRKEGFKQAKGHLIELDSKFRAKVKKFFEDHQAEPRELDEQAKLSLQIIKRIIEGKTRQMREENYNKVVAVMGS